ncbi:MAG TPA: hypothetical protein PLC79_08050 [Phycisphaerae bacterium]|nr:hypothetical protein [Phycisphaerae bacterium]
MTGGTLLPGQDDLTGERWTIRCFQSSGPDHERIVNNLAEQLRKIQGINASAVRVKHEAGVSILYYGTYRKQFDPRTNTTKFPPKLTQDIVLIRSLTMGSQTPFLMAQCELVDRKPVGPPEWDLQKAPGDLSLQIAVFYNEGDFQERELAAVQYVEALRKEGFEAWYHHYDNGRSIVCVGHFPASAVTLRMDGTQEFSPEVEALMRRNEDFRRMYVNGQAMKVRDPSGQFRPMPSVLVRTRAPGSEADAAGGLSAPDFSPELPRRQP